MVLAQVQEREDVGVPRLDVNGECSGTLVASLIDVTSCGVVRAQHGDNTVRIAICAGNVRPESGLDQTKESNIMSSVPCGTDTVDIEPDTARGLTDHRTALEGVVDPLYGVILHAYEEAGGKLRVGRASVEQRWGSVREVAF